MAVFVVALLSAVTMGVIQLYTLEIQIMANETFGAEALMIAQAGLNDAFAEIRQDSSWCAGFTNKAFADGSYTVLVTAESTVPPSKTDDELEVEALGPLYRGVTQDFSVSHPALMPEARAEDQRVFADLYRARGWAAS